MNEKDVSHIHGDQPAAVTADVIPDHKELAATAFQRTRMPMVVTDATQQDYPIVLANEAELDWIQCRRGSWQKLPVSPGSGNIQDRRFRDTSGDKGGARGQCRSSKLPQGWIGLLEPASPQPNSR